MSRPHGNKMRKDAKSRLHAQAQCYCKVYIFVIM